MCREDSGAGPAQQAEYDGRPQCRRQGKQPSGGQQGPGDAPAARRKRPRTLQTPQAQQEQAHAPEAGSSGSGSSGEHSESGQPEQLNQMEHDAVTYPVAQMPAASPVGPGRRYAKETLTLEVLEREVGAGRSAPVRLLHPPIAAAACLQAWAPVWCASAPRYAGAWCLGGWRGKQCALVRLQRVSACSSAAMPAPSSAGPSRPDSR